LSLAVPVATTAYADTQNVPFSVGDRFSATNIGVSGVINDFSNGIIPAIRWNKVFYLLDYSGNIIANVDFFRMGQFCDGLAPAEVNQYDKYGYINSTGQFVITPAFDTASNFYNGRAIVSVDGQFGIIDTTEKFVARFDKGEYVDGRFVGGVPCFVKLISHGPEEDDTLFDANGNVLISGNNIVYYDPYDGSTVQAIYSSDKSSNPMQIAQVNHYVVLDKNNKQIFALDKDFDFATYYGKDGIALIENRSTDELETIDKNGNIIAKVQGRGYLNI